ncbi:hypothetical protein FHS43_003164 [Streptosporangium becharense]|uniref:Sensor domain-containing protein n=1 Tax=Streptosporangium becharense TaxID=1816182 RepID=A0A7W9IDF6_9ACTN|nr:sensor domain-containing protein [Streptosporangium becharense]MBB2911884.1 hypothetical protein [Streptosporangium becharense]MBB5818431.1 hypothetical protein [Streptosporangium becharense]
MKKIIALACVAVAVAVPAASAIPAAAVAAPAIPKGFLLYEKDAAKKDDDPETNWKVSHSVKAKLAVNPCDRGSLARVGRVAARTVTFTGVPDFMKVEQVVLYASPADAAKAVTQVRSALAACGTTTSAGSTYRYVPTPVTGLGDEALKVSGQVYYGKKAGVGGDRSVLVRKGNAVLVYLWAGEYSAPAKADWATQLRDARRMTAKICAIAACR